MEESRCSCCGIPLLEENFYYYYDENGNEILDYPMCCECAA